MMTSRLSLSFVACVALVCGLFLSGLAVAQDFARQPEQATGVADKRLAIGKRHMVVAANPLAAEAGLEILRQGGSAADAAIAMQLVLGLVEPQSSGLGGGAFALHWDASKKALIAFDGRETAPAAARPDRFLSDGRPMPYRSAVKSGLSVGVPGVVRLLQEIHGKHGRLPWPTLFVPAITLADSGFPLSRRLNMLLDWQGAAAFDAEARRYFFTSEGKAHAVGHKLKNPAYASTLRRIASDGADAFYNGDVAAAIVASARRSGGDLTLEDLAGYRVVTREPLCFDYRDRSVCGIGPPSSGTLTIGQTLKLIEPFADVRGAQNRMSAAALHVIAEAEKLAYADRDRYIADPEFVKVPAGMLAPDYLATRRALINRDRAMVKPEPGLPPGASSRSHGQDFTMESVGTSHLSVVDSDGNAVSMTTTIESAFGSGRWAAGFLLNNELTDFSFRPTDKGGIAVANRVEAGKRPRSSMAPTMVFDAAGALEIVTGSPGGSRIIQYVAKTLIAMIDWEMDAQSAAALVNFGSDGDTFDIEIGWPGHGASSVWSALHMKSLGHEIKSAFMTSGIHTIQRRGQLLEGGADPRREGAALGD